MVILICFLSLLIPHAGVHESLLVCVLFFPVFLFGLLDLSQFFQNASSANELPLPQAPVLGSLYQRPPPSFR